MLGSDVLLLVSSILCVNGARILGVFPMSSKSHYILGRSLMKALAERGHQVTVISPVQLETPIPHYEQIYVNNTHKFDQDVAINEIINMENAWFVKKIMTLTNVVLSQSEILLNDNNVKQLLNSNEKFDLVIVNWSFTEVMLGFGHHFSVPVIALSPFGAIGFVTKITANPSPYAYVPNLITSSVDVMTFMERVKNTCTWILFDLLMHFVLDPAQEAMLHRFFPTAPPLQKLIQNISLVLVNSHFSIETPRPYVPNMIQIAGMHIEKPQPLPTDVQTFMDEAAEGVIYFSLGGTINSAGLAEDTFNAIVRTFKRLPLRVLWKLESNDQSKLPANVKIAKWFPQTDVLAHPNLRVFITHGGLLSITEAVYHGVPLVGIPISTDQKVNIKLAVHQGYCEMVEHLNEDSLTDAIRRVTNNPSYRENIQKRSRVLRDQPLKPLDNAVYWVEYVLRHKGAPHLQTQAPTLKWYQYYLIDIIGFLVGTFAFIVYIILKLMLILNRCFRYVKTVFKKDGPCEEKKKK